MEPALRDGDAIWVKDIDVTDVKVGDIVTMEPPGEESVTHRVIKIDPLSQGSHLVVTKGDANQFAEEWVISADGTLAVSVARVRFAGYVFEFFASMIVRALFIGVLVATLVAMWMRRRRMAIDAGK